MFPIVLCAVQDDAGYHFQTAGDISTPVKAPMGMFKDAIIDNDLRAVDSIIREYWSLAPLNKKGTAK